MAVSVYYNGKWHCLAGKKIWKDGAWKTPTDTSCIQYNGSWHVLGHAHAEAQSSVPSTGVITDISESPYYFSSISYDSSLSVNPTGRTYYVSPNGSGDGLTWDTSASPDDLNYLASKCRDGGTICLLEGEYIFTMPFTVHPKVNIVGGYSIADTSWSARDPFLHPTILKPADSSVTEAIVLKGTSSASQRIDGLCFHGFQKALKNFKASMLVNSSLVNVSGVESSLNNCISRVEDEYYSNGIVSKAHTETLSVEGSECTHCIFSAPFSINADVSGCVLACDLLTSVGIYGSVSSSAIRVYRLKVYRKNNVIQQISSCAIVSDYEVNAYAMISDSDVSVLKSANSVSQSIVCYGMSNCHVDSASEFKSNGNVSDCVISTIGMNCEGHDISDCRIVKTGTLRCRNCTGSEIDKGTLYIESASDSIFNECWSNSRVVSSGNKWIHSRGYAESCTGDIIVNGESDGIQGSLYDCVVYGGNYRNLSSMSVVSGSRLYDCNDIMVGNAVNSLFVNCAGHQYPSRQYKSLVTSSAKFCTFAKCDGSVEAGAGNVYWKCDGTIPPSKNAQSTYDEGNLITLSGSTQNTATRFADPTTFTTGWQDVGVCPGIDDPDGMAEWLEPFGDYHLTGESLLIGAIARNGTVLKDLDGNDRLNPTSLGCYEYAEPSSDSSEP